MNFKVLQSKPWLRLTFGMVFLGVAAMAAHKFGAGSFAAANTWVRKAVIARAPASEAHQLKLVSTSAAPGSEAVLPLTFNADGTESRLHFSLRFPVKTLLRPLVALSDEMSAAQLKVDDSLLAEGKLGIEINLPVGVTLTQGAHRLLNLRFTIANKTGVASLPVEFTDEPVMRGVWNNRAQSVSTGFVNAVIVSAPGFEGDVAPRPEGGNGSLSVADWAQIGRFAAGLDELAAGSEFQRTDCSPKAAAGDGQITIADWVQAGRYSAGLDAPTMANGPSAPIATVIEAATATLAAEQQTRVVRVLPATLTRGQQGNAAVEMAAQGNEFAVGFVLNFDPTQLRFVRAVAGSDATGANVIVNNNDAANGRIVFNLSLPFGQKFTVGARQIAVITFDVLQTSTLNSTTLSFSNGAVVDELAATLPATFTAGVITLTPTISQTPRITTLTPNSVVVGSLNLTFRVIGVNLTDGSVVRVNGQERVTEYVSATELRASLFPSDVEDANTLSITVRTPDGVVTNALNLQVANPVPTLTTITPDSVQTRSSGFAMTVTGTGFVPGIIAKVGTTNRTTNYVSPSQLTVQIPTSALTVAGTFDVTVTNPEPGGGISNALPFTVSDPKPIPRINTIAPTSKQAGTEGFTLTVTGSGYVRGSIVRWNGLDRVTTFVSSTQLTAAITTEDIASAGTASVTVYNAPPGGGVTASQIFNITQPPNPVPNLTALSPNSVTAGGSAFTLVLTGTGFVQNSVVRVNGQDRQTTFGSVTELRTVITAAEIANGGTLAIRVFNPAPGGGQSAELTLTVAFGVPTIASLSPISAVAGGPAFTLTVLGTNFAPGSVVRWNGENRPTTVVSVTELAAQISAADIANIGSARVNVFSPAGGSQGSTSTEATFTITQATRPVPRLTSITPSSVEAGSDALTLIVNGANFVSDSVIRVNGQARTTTFVNSTQLTTSLSASELATVTNFSITVFTPPAGGGESNQLPFSVTAPPNPRPTISNINPTTVATGSNGATLTVNGTGFIASSIVRFNGDPRPTTFVSATQLTAQLTANDVSVSGTATITVFNPAPGGGLTSPVTLNITNPTPVIVGLTPTVLAVGSSAVTLTVTGTGFVQGAQILVGGQTRLTTLVNATMLTTQLTAADQAAPVTLNIQVQNPAPGGGVSNIATLPVRPRNPLPRITNTNPVSVAAGANGFSLLVNGSNFAQGAVVRWNGHDRPTDFGSENLLVAQIPASDLAAGGNVTITVFNPAPGGGTSGGTQFQVINPAPRVTNLNPDTAIAGTGPITLLVNGGNFVTNSSVRFNGVDIPTVFVTSSQLSAQIPASAIGSGGTFPVSVFNTAPGGGTSGALNFIVTNPAPTLTQLLPNKISAGSPNFTLTVVGTGFVPSSVVRWNGQERQTTYVAPSQLTAVVTANDVAQMTTAQVTVTTPAPGGGTTAALTFTVTNEPNPLPALTALTPNAVFVGGQSFSLVISGSGFIGSSRAQWNGVDRPTTYVSATQLVAQVSATDLTATGAINITVVNPPAVGGGGGTSNALAFNILEQPAPVPVIISASPNTIIAGGSPIAVLVNGTGFTSSSKGRWNDSERPTTFVSATQLTVQLSSTDIASAGIGALTIYNASTTGGGGGFSNAASIRIIATPAAQIALSPVTPTTDDEIVLLISGEWHNGCVPRDPQVTLLGNEIRVSTSNPNQACTLAVTPWSLVVTVGRLAVPGNYSARVIHTSPEGIAEIGRLSFVVGNGRPVINAITPSQVLAGSSGFALTVSGNSFASGATVLLNGVPRETTFLRPTQLSAVITDADLAVATIYNVTVVNPPANGVGGGTSNAVALSVTNPVPLLTFLTPGRVTTGGAAFTLKVTGLGFVAGSVVRVNGIERPTTLIDGATVSAEIPASDIATQGMANVTVTNPAPGGGTSAPLSLVIDSQLICQTACFQSPQYYSLNLGRLPNGSVFIGGVNFNSPVTIQESLPEIRRALQGGRSVLQSLNAEFVAAQISVIQAGGTGQQQTGILNGSLRCYGLNFEPIVLDNGFVITVDSTIGDLFAQSRAAIIDGRSTDQLRLAQTLDQINGNSISNRCGGFLTGTGSETR